MTLVEKARELRALIEKAMTETASLTEAEAVSAPPPPDSTNPYMKGDKVKHNGKTWVSDIDGNVWEPGVYGWTEVAE